VTNPSHDQAAGATIGGILGFAKSLTLFTMINMQVVYETALLSMIGALVGFFITSILRFAKDKINKKWKR